MGARLLGLFVQHGAARSGVRGEAEESLALRLGRLAHDLAATLMQPALQRARTQTQR